MRNFRLFVPIIISVVAALSLSSSYAQDYTRQGLPEGAKARVGKGSISGDIMFSPEGTVLAVPCSAGVWLHDVETGAEINLLIGHTKQVNSIAFSPDGTKIAGVCWDRSIRLWDVRTGKSIHTLEGHTGGVDIMVFSPDGTNFASLGWDDTIRLWDVRTGKGTHTLEGHTRSVEAIAFSPDGTKLASAAWDYTIQLWDVRTGMGTHTLAQRRDSVIAITFSPDGSTLAGWREEEIRLWVIDTGEPVTAPERHQRWLSSSVFLPDGSTLVRDGMRSTIHSPYNRAVEAAPSLKNLLHKNEHVAFPPDGSALAFAMKGYDETVILLWDARTGKIRHSLSGHWDATNGSVYVALSPDGYTLASVGGWDSMVRLWDVRSGELLGRPATSTDLVRSIVFSPDGRTLVWNDGGIIRPWDVRTGVLRFRNIGGHSGGDRSIAFSPDGGTLVSGGWDGSIGLWDVRVPEQFQTFHAHEGGVNSVAFSPDGFTLASGGVDKTVCLWDGRTGEHRQTLTGHLDEIRSVAFSHDGEMLASASGGPYPESIGKTIWIWDVRTGEHLHILEGHTTSVSCVAFSPDAPVLASGSYDNTIRIWAARTGESMQILKGHTDWVSSVVFSPDGNTLVSGSRDSTILLWEFRRLTSWADIKHTSVVDRKRQRFNRSRLSALSIPMETALLANYPNPFNPETWIPYQLENPAQVTLTIYDMIGQAVRMLEVGHQPAGVYQRRDRAAYWDGRNEMGETVADGVYFYTLSAGDFTATRKMLVGK
ncbi:MAG: T9SS type A sorting domain-containing protein [Candidatus Poribacteria bacterium]|nr:T9SS type A sorting domain-containing protein [Candidatus Poribacteria bacterium]MDE0506116.1 T9SS type A sorting domain-containing protein [Candidatus Poribacteria bacterium]